ncbi:MAG TPA: PfkB family carbohydrate kinase, partial [Chloroflexota bacterium]|nr:PfkB family carbohydrate kinase [Chloroflexota bacterium]
PAVPPGGTSSVSGYRVQGGGLVATALVACARLGAQCALYSLLGDDAVGDQITAELENERVDVRGVFRVPGGASPFSFIHVDENSGERTIFHRSGASLDTDPALGGSLDLQGFHALVIDDIYPSLAALAACQAQELGIPVIADMIPSPANRQLLQHVDILIAPKHYASQAGFASHPEQVLEQIHQMGPSTAVLTLGADGWIYSAPDGAGHGEAFQVEVMDTTGAGDSFHGAFAYGAALGWETSRCCEFAGAVAAIKCTKPGGRSGLPDLGQALAFLTERNRAGWGGLGESQAEERSR